MVRQTQKPDPESCRAQWCVGGTAWVLLFFRTTFSCLRYAMTALPSDTKPKAQGPCQHALVGGSPHALVIDHTQTSSLNTRGTGSPHRSNHQTQIVPWK